MAGSSVQGNLLGLTREELEQLAAACGQPPYRGRQLYKGIYARREQCFDRLTDLGQDFRAFLAAHHRIRYPELQSAFRSRDGAVRHLLRLEDGNTIEAVYMPEEARATLCLSSQVGCALDCRFCFTALVGVKRNLTAGEMLGQVLALVQAHRIPRRARLNVVFMGMGEPLLNLGPVMQAVRILADRDGVGIPLRRITLSTAGIVPRIYELAREPQRPKLAVSLNASTDEQRTALMPLNRKYPLSELLRACRSYPLRPRERLTFEYVLLDGINDSAEDAGRVAKLLQSLRCKVNLIPYNSGPQLPYRPPPLERVMKFQEVLTQRRIPAFIRISRGQDVRGACGQLSLAGVDGEIGRSAPA
jgi:23S rRNA (adenine2503-C2)-methyltransferase